MSCICFKCYSYEDPKKFAFKLFCHSRTIKNDVSRFREWSTEMFCRTAKKHCNEISQSANPETWKNSFGGHCTGLDKTAFTWLIDFLPIFPKKRQWEAVGQKREIQNPESLLVQLRDTEDLQRDWPQPQPPVALAAGHRGELEPADGGGVVGGAGHPVALGQLGAAGGDRGLAADGARREERLGLLYRVVQLNFAPELKY